MRIEDAHAILYPFQVESIALEDPLVRRAALFTHQDRRILAVEAMHPIDTVQVLPRIPVDRRHNSKIDYPALRRMLDRPQRTRESK